MRQADHHKLPGFSLSVTAIVLHSVMELAYPIVSRPTYAVRIGKRLPMKSSIRIERRNDRCCQLYWGGAMIGCLLITGCEKRQPLAAPNSTTTSTPNKRPGTSITCVAFSPDGDILATSSDDRTVKLWHVATEQETVTFNGHTAEVLSVAFSPDGKTIASGSVDRTARLWSVTTRKEIATLTGHHDIVGSVAFSPDGQALATGSWDGTAKLWEVAAGKELATLTGHMGPVKAVAFAPDGKTLATGSVDNTIKLWDVARRAERATLAGHSAPVLALMFNADGKTLASGSEDGSIRLWDLDSRSLSPYSALFDASPPFGQRGVLLARSKVWTVAFAPGDHLLASGQENGTVMIWDLKFQKARRPKQAGERVYKSARKDGRMVSWFVRTIQAEETGRVYSAAFWPNGRKLVTGGSPGGFVVYGGESPWSVSVPAKPVVKPLMWWNLE